MKRSRRLAPILDLAEKKEQDAAKVFAQQLQKIQVLTQARDNLRGFLDNYHARFQQSGAGGMTVSQLAEYRAFLGKINGAIDEHTVTLRLAEEELEAKRRLWEEARQGREGMAKLIQQAHKEEEKLESKREQADMDERAARKALRNPSSTE